MKNEINRSAVIINLIWKVLEVGGTQGIQFIIQIILARILLPADYGMIALVAIFIQIANVFVQSGFNTALIQKKDADDIDFSSVFYLSVFVASLLYVLLFFASPLIASFYENPLLTSVLRVLAISLFIGAFNSIQNAVVARKMDFKKLFFSSLSAVVISGTVGIVMAHRGFGIWALVAQQLLNQVCISIILWFTVKWRPKLLFSFKRVRSLFAYGGNLLLSSLIETLYMNLRGLIIGKIYTADMLSFFNRGRQFPALIVTNVIGAIQSVMLPVLAAEQDNRQRVKEMVRRSIVTSSFVLFPLMVGLAVCAEPLVKILMTEKWLPCVPYVQVFCATFALWPIHTANLQALKALGQSDIYLKLEIIKKVLGLAILGITIPFGVYAIALGGLVSGVIATFINVYPNIKLLNYSYQEQMKDIFPSLLLSFWMGVVVYCVQYLGMSEWQTLLLQICLGTVIYLGTARICNLECFNYLTILIKQMIQKKTSPELSSNSSNTSNSSSLKAQEPGENYLI